MTTTSINIPKKGAIQKSSETNLLLSSINTKFPLANLNLALDDWGQSPWRLQRVVSEASLLFERNSDDPDKRQTALDAKKNIESRIEMLKGQYAEVVRANGPNDEVARKLEDDISFSETMYAFIQAQVNGLVSLQKSWKARSNEINQYYEQRMAMGTWEKLKKNFPFLNGAIGTTAGLAAWMLNGWDGIVLAIQTGVKMIPGIKEADPKMVDDIVKLAVNVAGVIGLTALTAKLDKRWLDKKANLEKECTEKQNVLIEEEKKSRRIFLSLIKEKAIELNAKYGYLLELEKEDGEISRLTEADNFDGINAAHKARVKKILGSDIPDLLLTGTESDTNSTDINNGKAVPDSIAKPVEQDKKA